jgi:hypothetical protein
MFFEIFSALATATPICEFLGMALDKLQKKMLKKGKFLGG